MFATTDLGLEEGIDAADDADLDAIVRTLDARAPEKGYSDETRSLRVHVLAVPSLPGAVVEVWERDSASIGALVDCFSVRLDA